jgi:hypothetical protein
MTQNNKPEWFKIVEADGPAAPVKASKTLPIAAFMVTALILGVGTLVGQVETESPASATQENVITTAPIKSAAVSPVPPVVAAPTSHLANPSIATLPTNGDDEHEEEDDD